MVLRDGPTARGAAVRMPFKSFAWSSRGSARNLDCDHREHHAKPNTSHEVTAARAGRPSGRTAFKQILRRSKTKSQNATFAVCREVAP